MTENMSSVIPNTATPSAIYTAVAMYCIMKKGWNRN